MILRWLLLAAVLVVAPLAGDELLQPAVVGNLFPRVAESGKPAPGPSAAVKVITTAKAGSRAYEWALWSVMDNYADEGENAGHVTQAYKRGAGSTWAFNADMHCLAPGGGCFTSELDLTIAGPQPWGDLRIGQMINLWNGDPFSGLAYAEHALLLTEAPYRSDTVRVARALAIEFTCTQACLTVRAGQRIGLNEDGSIAIRYNKAAKRIEYLDGDTVIASVQTIH